MKHQPIFSSWICKGHPLPGSHLEKMLFQYSFLPAMKFYWFSILIHPTFLIPNFARICLYPWCLLVSVWGRLFYILKAEELNVSIEKREAEIEILSIPESMGMVALCSQSTADYKAPCRSCVKGGCKFWCCWRVNSTSPVHSLWSLKHPWLFLLLLFLLVRVDDRVLGDGGLLGGQAHDVPHISGTRHLEDVLVSFWNRPVWFLSIAIFIF